MKLFKFLVSFAVLISAAEIATTQGGRKVLLKNDGTWEVFNEQKHLEVRDLRDAPERIQIEVKFKSAKYYEDEKKLEWEAYGIKGTDLKDSLKSLPNGGIVYMLMNESAIQKSDPKCYSFTVKDTKSTLITDKGCDSEARASDDIGIMILKEFYLKSAPKGTINIDVYDKVIDKTYNFQIAQ
jgi:hypothetical protein